MIFVSSPDLANHTVLHILLPKSNATPFTGFVRVLENLESPGILLCHFPGLESPGKWLLVLESSGICLTHSKICKKNMKCMADNKEN